MTLSPRDKPGDSVPPLSASVAAAPQRPRPQAVVFVAMALGGLSAAAVAGAWQRTRAYAASSAPPSVLSPVQEAPRLSGVSHLGSGVKSDVPPVPDSPAPDPLPDRAVTGDDPEPTTLDAQIERLIRRLRVEHRLSEAQVARVQAIFDASPVLSQGNPVISKHPITRAECHRIRTEAGLGPTDLPKCGAPHMVPIFDPSAGQTAADAKMCIDQFEFPDIPCEFPVVHVRANEASELCQAMGKRLCDAHEWEGACAGAVHDPSVEYEWPKDRMQAEFWHNHDRDVVWSYGPKKNHALCGTHSERTPSCPGGGWNKCGSNTYPTGSFPACKSSFGAYDFHGNAAEHMNLPLTPAELGTHGGGGVTEMKGSWFVFSTIEAHIDDCRWRAPSWHESRVANTNSHRNYHLGFRCCNDVD